MRTIALFATEHIFPGLLTSKMVSELPWYQKKNVWNEVKKFSNHFRRYLADLKSTNSIQKYQSGEKLLCFEHF